MPRRRHRRRLGRPRRLHRPRHRRYLAGAPRRASCGKARMFDERRLYTHIDWLLLGAVLTLAFMGLAMIYSTTFNPITNRVGPQFWTQLYALGLGLMAMAVVVMIDYRRLCENSLAIYI